ncbi:MAG: TRAP transporter substrate-binding protein [Syntrophaceae bacterium]|jgi:TRAP-type C4-dicarboxylate transport system substrate-binding protein|nr:TRAP transporter substrate-binding protein [Syntrophaceae bacterium]
MKIRKLKLAWLGMGCLAVIFMAGTSWAQTKWDMPMAYPVGNFHSVNGQKFADAVKQRTGGKLEIVVHAGASLFKLPEIKRAVQTGQAQIGETLMVLHANEYPVYEADGVPFLAAGYDQVRKLYTAQKPFVEKKLASEGMMLLYAVPWPPQAIYSNRELKTIKDLEGLAWRAYSPATMRVAELVKAQPVTIQAAELSQALATGKVNAMMTSGATGVDSKVWEQVKYFYDTQAWQPKNMVIVNKAAFNKLDKATQNILVEEAKKAEAAGWEASQKVNKESIETLKKNGMIVQAPSPELKKGLEDVGKIMIEEWLKKAGDDGKKVLEAYRKM